MKPFNLKKICATFYKKKKINLDVHTTSNALFFLLYLFNCLNTLDIITIIYMHNAYFITYFHHYTDFILYFTTLYHNVMLYTHTPNK